MNKQYLQCKKISTAISRAQKILIKKAKKEGLYENFGQKEVMEIRDKFINISKYTSEMNSMRNELQSFNIWCQNYTEVV